MSSSWIRSNLTCIILYRVMYLLWFPVWKHHTSWGRAFGRGTGRMVSSGPKYPKCAHALAMSVSDRPGVQTHGILCLNLEGGVVWSWGSPKWLVYFMEKSYLEAGWRWLTFFCNAMQRLQCHVHNMNWSDTRAESEVTKLTWDMIWYDIIVTWEICQSSHRCHVLHVIHTRYWAWDAVSHPQPFSLCGRKSLASCTRLQTLRLVCRGIFKVWHHWRSIRSTIGPRCRSFVSWKALHSSGTPTSVLDSLRILPSCDENLKNP